MSSFIFVLLLPLAATSTVKSELQINITNVTAGGTTPAQQPSTSEQLSEIPPVNATTATSVDGNPAEETSSSAPSLHITQTMPPAILSTNTKRAPTLTSSSRTTVKSKVWKPGTTLLTSQRISNSTEPLMLSNFPQSHGTERTSTSQIKVNETTSSFTSAPNSTTIHTDATSIKPEDKISTSTKSVPGDDRTQSSTSEASTVTPNITEKKKAAQHSKVVAAIIGSALSLMIAGFLLIYIRKQRRHKQPTTTNWAGPSPLLEGEANNGNTGLRSSNRISLISFLPHRISKRFSLLPETNEMKEMTPKATSEEKHQGSTFGQAMDASDAQEKNLTEAVPEVKISGEAEEAAVRPL